MTAFGGLLMLLATAFTPGWAVVALTSPRRLPWWLLLPLAPLLSCGAVYAVAAVLSLVRLPFTAPNVGAGLVVLIAAAVIRRRRTAGRGRDLDDADEVGPRRLEIIGLAGVVAAAVTFWLFARGGSGVLPNFDSMTHAQFIHVIATRHITDPTVVTSPNPLLPDVPNAFYPLAMHELAAFVVEVSGASVAATLFAMVVLFAAVAAPLGMYALARELRLPGSAPLLTAAVIVTVPEMYKPVTWGGLASLVAMSALPAALAVALRLLRQVGASAWPVVAAAAGALAGVHSSELVAFVLLIPLLVLPAAWRAQHWQLLRWRPIVAAIAIGAVLLSAQVAGLLSNAGTIADQGGGKQYLDGRAFGQQVLTLSFGGVIPYLWLSIVLVAALLLALIRRRNLGLVAAFAVFTALAGWAAHVLPGWPVLQRLTIPWYEQTERLGYYLAWFAAPLIAVLLDTLIAETGRLAARPPSGRSPTEQQAAGRALRRPVVGALCLPVLLAGAFATLTLLHDSFATDAVVTASVREWGVKHPQIARGDITVLADPASGAMWLYAESGVRVWGSYGDVPTPRTRAWAQRRRYLLEHITEYPTNPAEVAAVKAGHVRYLFVNETIGSGLEPDGIDALLHDRYLRLVDHSAQAYLFELTTTS